MRYSEIKYRTLSTWFVITFLRQVKQIKWIYSLLAPLLSLYDDILYKMQHDGRVIYLEKVLNEKNNVVGYDPNNHENTKQIRITDNYVPKAQWLYLEIEERPLFEPIVLYKQAELDVVDEIYADFTVHVPTALTTDTGALERLLDYFRLAGKRFKIKMT